MVNVGISSAQTTGFREATEQHVEALEPARVPLGGPQGVSAEDNHRVEAPQEEAMHGVETAEDLHEPLQRGNGVGETEGLGEPGQPPGLGEVVEDRFDERLATAKPVIDGDASDTRFARHSLEREGIAADQHALRGVDDPAACRVHVGATLLELIRSGAHDCFSAYTVYAVNGNPISDPDPWRGTLMTLYSFALFIHIIGSLLLCIAFTAEGIGLLQFRRATTNSAIRQWEGVLGLGRVFGPASVVTILASGLYLMISSWGWVPWIAVGLLAWVLIAVLGAVNGIRLSLTIRQLPAGAAPGTSLQSRAFVISWVTRLSIAVGIVFVMTSKPDLLGALLSILITAAFGVASGVAMTRRGATRSPAV